MPTCFGCFVNWPYLRAPQQFDQITPSSGLGHDERTILGYLAEAWEVFKMLPPGHPDDDAEFKKAIHDAQKIIALRVARRIDKDVWKQPESTFVDK